MSESSRQQSETTMAFGAFIDKAKKAAQDAAAKAQKEAERLVAEHKDEVLGSVKDVIDIGTENIQELGATLATTKEALTENIAEGKEYLKQQRQQLVDEAMRTTSEFTGLSGDELNARLAAAGTAVTDAASTAGNAIGTAASVTSEYAVKAGKTVSGVQAYQDRKEATRLHDESTAIVTEIEQGNEARRAELSQCLSNFGKVRTEALHNVVGRFLRLLDEMGKRNKEKEYEMLGVADITVENVGQMQQLDMGASEALKTLGAAGGFAGIALAGTPTLVTGAVTALATASTGTAISSLSGAAATNAVLAWLGGGSIAAGGGGMAAGATVLAGITYAATGVFAVAAAGVVATAFYSKKLTEATAEKAKVEQWAADVRQGWVVMDGIKLRANELRKLTLELKERGGQLLDNLQDVVATFNNNNLDHVRLFQQSALLVKSMTELAQTPLLDDEGNVSSAAVSVQSKVETVLNNDLK